MTDIARLDIQVNTAGPKAAVQELERLNTQAQRTVTITSRLGTQWGQTGAQVNTAAKQTEKAVERVGEAMRKTAKEAEQANKQLGLSRQGLINLSYQLNDVATSLASGGSPMMVLAQQGGQVFQIMQNATGGVAAGFSHVGRIVSGLLTPLRLIGGTVAAVGVLGAMAFKNWDDAITNARRSLNGIGGLSGTTAQELTRIAQRGASAGNISAGQGLAAAGSFAQAGFSAANIQQLVAGVGAYSRAFGGDISENTDMLAKTFADVEKAADFVQKRFLLMDAQTKENILSLYRSGQSEQARNLLVTEFNRGLASTTQALSVLESVTQSVRNGISQFWVNVSRGVDRLVRGPTQQDRMDSLRSRRDDFVDLLNSRGASLTDAQRQALLGEINRINSELIDLAKSQAEQYLKIEKEKQDKLKAELQSRAMDAIQSLTPEVETLKKLVEQAKLLNQAGADSEQARLAMERLQSAIRNFQTPLQQIVTDSQLAVRSIMARTLQERVGVEMRQAEINALRQMKTELEATTAAEAARNRVLADAAREARDAARDARNEGSLIGLNETQRELMQIQIRFREMYERLIGGPRLEDYQSKFTNRAGSTFNPVPTSPFAFPNVVQIPTALSPNGAALGPLSRQMGQFPFDPNSVTGVGAGNAAVAGSRERINTLNEEAGALRRRTAAELESAQATSVANVTRRAIADLERQGIAAMVNASAQIEAQRAAYTMGGEAAAIYAEKMKLIAQATINGTIALPGVREKIDEVAQAMGRASYMGQQFTEAIRRIDEVRGMAGDAFNTFFSGLARGESAAKSMRNAVQGLTQSLIRMATNLLMSGLFGNQQGGGLLSGIFSALLPGGTNPLGGTGPMNLAAVGSALGNVFSGGRLVPFANGGVVGSPTMFPMKGGGLGLMGEAGPEAIMPLKRDSAGRLGVGVASQMGGNVDVRVYNQTGAQVETRTKKNPDGSRMVEFFITAMGDAMARGKFDESMQRFGSRPRITQR